MDFAPLTVVLLLLAVTLGAVTVLNILRLPTLPAYFIAGAAAGPHGIGVLATGEVAHFVAELGVIFLLFTIGLEFSLSAFNAIRRYVLALGALQVGVCGAVFGAAGWFLTGDAQSAALIGAVAAMSSTAIVSQLLIKDNAVTSPAGRRAIAVLLFQDLAVVPLIVIFSSLNETANMSSLPGIVALILLKCVGLAVAVFLVCRPLIGRWLNWTHRHGDKELFILNLLALIVIASGLTAFFDLSYSLGAFLAGMLVAETMHRHRVEHVVEPFRHLFLGFFFISLGLLIDPAVLYEHWHLVLALAAVFCLLKTFLVYVCVRVIGAFRRTALRGALLLGGAGEFGFVLLTIAGEGILHESWFQLILLANLIAMLPVSLIWPLQHRIVNKVFPQQGAAAGDELKNAMPDSDIIIAGFGRTGQAVAGVFREMGARYAMIEDDYQILQAASGAENIIYGEGERMESLEKVGLEKAKYFIITYMESLSVLNAIDAARSVNPGVRIIVKASNAAQAERFAKAGADDVLIESHEAGFSLARLVAQGMGHNRDDLNRIIKEGKRRANPFYSGEYGGAAREGEGSKFVACVAARDVPPAELSQLLAECKVLSWRRNNSPLKPDAAVRQGLKSGDHLVLSGGEGTAQLTDIKNTLEGAETYLAEEEEEE